MGDKKLLTKEAIQSRIEDCNLQFENYQELVKFALTKDAKYFADLITADRKSRKKRLQSCL